MLKIIYFSSVSQTVVEFTILLAYDIILYKEEKRILFTFNLKKAVKITNSTVFLYYK